jgi:hypothetical protein
MNLWNIIPIDEELKKYYIKHQGLINKWQVIISTSTK